MNVDIPTPNSHIMVHHYCSEEHLFRTITMYDDNEREDVYRDILANKSWYGGRFAQGHREAYMQKRVELDRLISKYPNDNDLYFEVQVWDKDVLYAWKRKLIQANQKPAYKALADIAVGR
jgi:hypothetical protein